MVEALRRRQPGSPLWRIVCWYGMHFLCYLWFLACYRFRAWGVRRVPETGPLMLVSNHQSFLDPIVVGLGAHRRQFYALARSTLWDHKWLAGLINLLNAIPVEQGVGDTRAMRQGIDALKRDQALLIFPEGARTETGRTDDFLPGTMLLIKRAKPTVLPVAIEGAYEVWPRGRKLPRLFGRIGVMYGEPIEAEELLAKGSEGALAHLHDRVEAMRAEVRERLER